MANVMINGEPAAADVGEDLLTVARRQGAVIGFLCDGRGMCTTCQCQVVAGAGELTPPNEVERTWLTEEQLGRDERLACQARLAGEGAVAVVTGAETIRQQLRSVIEAGVSPRAAVQLAGLMSGLGASAAQVARGFPMNVLRTWPRFLEMPPHLPGITKYVVDSGRVVTRAIQPGAGEGAAENLTARPVPIEDGSREAVGPGADI